MKIDQRLTTSNRKKLLEILEPNILERLICFPWKTLERNERYRRKTGITTYGMALDICCSVAVAILLTLPLRRGNLCRLEWQRHISTDPAGDSGFLNIPRSQVKNKRPLTALLPRVRREAVLPEDLQMKDFRSTMLNELADAGVTKDELMAISGHMHRETLKHYVHPRKNRSSEAFAKLEKRRKAK